MRFTGQDILFYVDDTPVAFSTSCDVQASCDMTEISSFLSSRARRFRPGRYAWQTSCDAIASDNGEAIALLAALKHGDRLKVTMSANIEGKSIGVWGYAFVAQWSEGAPLGSMATYKVQLQGDDELHIFALPL